MTVVYDKAKYQIEGDFPDGIAFEQAYVHTGMFLGWIVDHQLYSEEFEEDALDEIEKFKTRHVTGPQLYQAWDGVLADDMLNDEGNAFAQSYFDFEQGLFLQDYDNVLSGYDSFYHVEDTWENYFKIKEKMDQRFQEWKKAKDPA
ncbi:hypothetical protein [Lysinibacillus cavernae]|uniref:DUF7832 domain-containing protein n=1 Tax=Lysinibacillus cavernae TaxID=2666135 RepID=UPI0012D933E1|nr:hypothetical protein [Lysinibacillus cavernae]